MYKTLIADDEPLFRKALMMLVDWAALGFEVVGEAIHGAEALAFLQNHPVDLLITDIRMPVMDGLDLLKNVSRDFPAVSTVMLSSYDDFHLVRDAFRLGACDYVLKTDLNPVTVSETLGKLSEILDMRCKGRELPAPPENSTQGYQPHPADLSAMREKFFRELIWGYNYNPGTLDADMRALGIRLQPGGLIVMVLCADNFMQTASAPAWEDKRELLSYAILNIISEKLEDFGHSSVFAYSQSEYVLIFNADRADGYAYHTDRLGSLFEDLRKCLEAYLHIHITAGVSNLENGFTQLSRLYDQASGALKYGSVMGRGRFIIYSVHHHPATDAQDLTAFITGAPLLLSASLDAMDAAKLRDVIPRICLSQRYIPLDFIDDIYQLYDRHAFILSAFATRHNLSSSLKASLDHYNAMRHAATASLRDYDLWLRQALELCAMALSSGQDTASRAKKYIETRYHEDISLETAADSLGTTPSYLSRIFVRDTGTNFVDYLTDTRIHHARELLQNTNLKMYEIAAQVGFNSVEYFSRVYKKRTGKSPKRQK